jgi:hypothetical protein
VELASEIVATHANFSRTNAFLSNVSTLIFDFSTKESLDLIVNKLYDLINNNNMLKNTPRPWCIYTQSTGNHHVTDPDRYFSQKNKWLIQGKK